MTEREQLEQAIAMQETLRGTLPDGVVDSTIAALREKLAAVEQTPHEEQRKLVTVLFADLADWTVMSERTDAEDLREIQQAYFAAVTPPILQRGGRVDSYLGINAAKPPFDDSRVRRAMVMATDREAYVDVVLHGLAMPPTGGFVPPDLPGHSPGIALPYDPAKARQLLDEAGYPDGCGFPPAHVLVSDPAIPFIDFQTHQWRSNLGIEVTTERLDFRAFIEALHSASPSLFCWGWIADYPDPDNFLRVGLKLIRSWWRNDPFEALVRQAKQMTDPRERMKLYRQADQILIEEAAIMPLYYSRDPLLLKPWLTIFQNGRLAHTKDFIIRPHQEHYA